jgi:two-component system chemotaxis response regulator CheY
MPERGRVLVIDDDADIREALQDTLEQEGYLVASAGDGLEALMFLEANPVPALILLDWNMAPMNAEGFMEVFGKDPRFVGVPVVLVTADPRASESAREGYAGFLKKPVKLEALFAVVARHCQSLATPDA